MDNFSEGCKDCWKGIEDCFKGCLKGIEDCLKRSEKNSRTSTMDPTTTHAIPPPLSKEYKQPGNHFDASQSGHQARHPTVTNGNSVPSNQGKTEQSHMKPEASISAPAHGKPSQPGDLTTIHAIPAPSSQEYKQPGNHFDVSQSGPQARQPRVSYGNSVPSNQGKTEPSHMKPEASISAPAHGKPSQTGDVISVPSSLEYKHPGIHVKPAKTVEPNALREELVRNEKPIRKILGKSFKEIPLQYKLGKELGKGHSSIVYQCTEIFTGKTYACKSISKENPANFNEEDVRREVKILERLRRQPNIVEFKEAYEDEHSIHLVMELCTGGELLDKIIAKRNYSEREAASVFRSIVNIISTCHAMGVMHRDIKPENFLLSTELENSDIKAIDFGSSVFIEEGVEYRDIVGTAYYVAPEVLHHCYSKEADIWSAGVILYILLSGVPPFRGDTKAKIYDAILSKELDLESPPWSSISSSAKDLVRKILNKDPKRRISLPGILGHPWVQEGGEASDKPLDDVVILRIKQTQQRPGRYRFN